MASACGPVEVDAVGKSQVSEKKDKRSQPHLGLGLGLFVSGLRKEAAEPGVNMQTLHRKVLCQVMCCEVAVVTTLCIEPNTEITCKYS